jgi:DNA-binding response OmpR family regulator
MGKRVWVAEDDGELRRLLVAVLRKDGHQVRELGDGAELWQALESALESADLPNLVLSDQAMPHLSGVDVLARLRQAGAAVPFILITAFPSEETRRAASAHGAQVFNKPFDLKLIRETVRSLA